MGIINWNVPHIFYLFKMEISLHIIFCLSHHYKLHMGEQRMYFLCLDIFQLRGTVIGLQELNPRNLTWGALSEPGPNSRIKILGFVLVYWPTGECQKEHCMCVCGKDMGSYAQRVEHSRLYFFKDDHESIITHLFTMGLWVSFHRWDLFSSPWFWVALWLWQKWCYMASKALSWKVMNL